MRSGRKQRHTAKRVHDRLVAEKQTDVSLSTVERYVREAKARRARGSSSTSTWTGLRARWSVNTYLDKS